ncbi:MAG: AtpZ/AtpI family protein [Acidimicrobiales bacterium]
MDFRERSELNNGLDTGMSRAMELVFTPLIFAGAGVLLDRWLGTGPIFAIVLGVLALIGVSYMTWLRYEMEMREHDRRGVWTPRNQMTSDKAPHDRASSALQDVS